MTGHDAFASRVLAALTSGAESASTLAMRMSLGPDEVAGVLERSVMDGLVSRIDLGGTPVYRLTPQGLDLVGAVPEGDPVAERGGSSPGVPPTPPEPARDVPDHRDLALPASLEPVRAEPPSAARRDAARTRGSVTWRHVGYAVAYVVVGVFILLELSVAVGALAILAGLAIGVVSLRPLWRAPERTSRTP